MQFSHNPGSEKGFIKRYYTLLHVTRGAFQEVGGAYKKRLPISQDDIARHLRGDTTIALCCVNRKRASLIGIDVDASFPMRLVVLEDVLREVGLDRATFVTPGSDPGRGKIVICIDRPVPQSLAMSVAKIVHRKAVADPKFGVVGKDEVDSYPIGGEGGLFRVLGRNPKRNGSLEIPLRLADGQVSDLTEVEPASEADLERIIQHCGGSSPIAPDRDPKGVRPIHPNVPDSQQWNPQAYGGRLNRWAIMELKRSWTWGPDGTRGVLSRVVALAYEFRFVFGPTYGEAQFRAALDHIQANSPDLDTPSPKTRDERNPLTWERTGHNAWRYACDYKFLKTEAVNNATPRLLSLYDALIEYVHLNRLRPYAFNMTYERIAKLIGKSATTAWRTVRDANGTLLVILDPGAKRERGQKIQTVRLGLIGFGETSEIIREKARTRTRYVQPSVWGSLRSRHHVGSSGISSFSNSIQNVTSAFQSSNRKRRSRKRWVNMLCECGGLPPG